MENVDTAIVVAIAVGSMWQVCAGVSLAILAADGFEYGGHRLPLAICIVDIVPTVAVLAELGFPLVVVVCLVIALTIGCVIGAAA